MTTDCRFRDIQVMPRVSVRRRSSWFQVRIRTKNSQMWLEAERWWVGSLPDALTAPRTDYLLGAYLSCNPFKILIIYNKFTAIL